MFGGFRKKTPGGCNARYLWVERQAVCVRVSGTFKSVGNRADVCARN